MLDLLSFLSFSGIGVAGAYYANKYNKSLKKKRFIINSLNNNQWTINELFAQDNSSIDEFFAERETTLRAESMNKNPNSALKERKSKSYMKKMSYMDTISIGKNYETKDIASFKVSVEGRLFNEKPFIVNLQEKNDLEARKVSMIYIDKETTSKRGDFHSTKIADFNSFFVTSKNKKKDSRLYKSGRGKQLSLSGLNTSMILGLVTVSGNIKNEGTAGKGFQNFVGAVSNFMLGREVTYGVSFEGNVQGVKNGVEVFFLSDMVLDKMTNKVKLMNPRYLSLSKGKMLEELRKKHYKYLVLTLLGVGGVLFAAYNIAKNFRRYRRSLRRFKNYIFQRIDAELHDQNTINVSTINCRNCRNGKREVIFIPCNHLILCKNCFDNLAGNPKRCPQCDRAVNNFHQMFIS